MLSYVNPKIEVREAGLKGRGLFAKEDINRGEIIVIEGGQIVEHKYMDKPPYNEFDMICYQVERGFRICPAELDKNKLYGVFMMNHSCEPNCGLKNQITFIAMRDIQRNEEITYDYAMTDSNYEEAGYNFIILECLCGASNCRGVITDDDWRREDLQEKYKGYFSPYLQTMIKESRGRR